MYFTTGEKERTGPEAVPSARSSAESSMKIAKYVIAVPVNTKDLNNAVSGVKFKIAEITVFCTVELAPKCKKIVWSNLS